jgi:hypothetical protein
MIWQNFLQSSGKVDKKRKQINGLIWRSLYSAIFISEVKQPTTPTHKKASIDNVKMTPKDFFSQVTFGKDILEALKGKPSSPQVSHLSILSLRPPPNGNLVPVPGMYLEV